MKLPQASLSFTTSNLREIFESLKFLKYDHITFSAEKVIWSYFKNFKDSKISLKLLVVNDKDACGSFKNKNIINLNFSRFIYAIPRILSILKSENIDVVISTFPNISAILLLSLIHISDPTRQL